MDDPEVVVLTFDDGYKDMLTTVAPELEKRGWSATVFLACRLVDRGRADFAPWAELLSWSEAEQLVKAGWEVGSHSLTHPDLTTLDESSLEKEVGDSRLELEQRLGLPVKSFAAPSGRTNERVQECIRRHYALAVTTELAVAGEEHDLSALPRLEMHYFQAAKRFEDQMKGRGDIYLGWRRTLRRIKQTLERSR
jgi:peptidoglycan/xylan/chitin deacetylase (PgdA/CDA1 family)